MRKLGPYWLAALLLLFAGVARATVFGNIRGIVHDPQHRPIQGATATVKAKASDWTKTATTDANGEFLINAVPIGEYSVTITSAGFATAEQNVVVESGTEPVLHFALSLAGANETVRVSGVSEVQPTDSATPVTLISRQDIERTPGADRTNSLAMITDYVPGSYFTHDMLHMRGGHQTSWLLDGVPMINTAIAATLGPQIDPKDIDYLEVNRGSYGAEFGDRTYGVFNVVPRTGFERNNDAELTVSAGNFHQTNDDFSVGGHTDRFAYYTSVNGNRSDLGLQTPVPQVVHDAANGYGAFGSFIFNANPANQLRLMITARKDSYQIPYDPNPSDIENGAIAANGFSPQWQSLGLRDTQNEADTGVILSWVHTFNSNVLMTISPFYHYNSGNYSSSPSDTPVATTENRASTYAGGQGSVSVRFARNNLQAGFFSFYQSDNQFFGAVFNDGSGTAPVADTEHPTANVETFFVEDKFEAFSWLTLSAGMRPTRFSGDYANGFTETSVSPRLGA